MPQKDPVTQAAEHTPAPKDPQEQTPGRAFPTIVIVVGLLFAAMLAVVAVVLAP